MSLRTLTRVDPDWKPAPDEQVVVECHDWISRPMTPGRARAWLEQTEKLGCPHHHALRPYIDQEPGSRIPEVPYD